MIYLIDTGSLVAAFRKPQDKDPFTPWAANLVRSLPYPLITCDAVLTEAAHFLGSSAKLLEAMKRGLLVTRFDAQSAAPRLAALVAKYADRPMDFADACLVCMSEQIRDCTIVTIDRADFAAYRSLIWIPEGAEFLPFVELNNIVVESIDPESALVSKAVKAPEKNRQLIRQAIASNQFPALVDRILKNGGELEEFL